MLSGHALILGDDVNTDELHPSRFYSLNDAVVRQGFLGAVEGHEGTGKDEHRGRIVLAGANFGIGSSRETGARVFCLAGIQAVVAVSFARIFYRNLLNLGMPAITCPGLEGLSIAEGASVSLHIAEGRLEVDGHSLETLPLDPHWRRVLDAGGLANWLGL